MKRARAVDTRFLESFLTFIECGSIAEAARRQDITPAALAQRIRTLEAEWGVRLLTRSGQKVQPTRAGSAIVARARKLLSDARELHAVANADALSGKLRLGAISTALTGILPEILSALVEQHARIDVYVVPGTSVDLYQKILSGALDAAILVQPPFELPKSCGWMLLRKEPLVLISSKETPIKDPTSLLEREPFIRYDRSHWGGRIADRYLRQLGVVPRDRFELDALDAIAIMVARGLGVSLVPRWAPPWPQNVELNEFTIDAPSFTRRVGLLWMRSSANTRLIKVFQSHTRAVLRR